MKTFRLYGLKREDEDIIRYIGITCQSLKKRLANHIFDLRGRSPKKENWIKKMMRDGVAPEICEYATGLTFEEAASLEIFVISELKKAGCPLVNSATGGSAGMLGRSHSAASRAKISRTHRGVPKSLEHREKLRVANLGKKQSSETIAKRVLKTSGKKRTSEFCRNRSGEKGTMFGRVGPKSPNFGRKPQKSSSVFIGVTWKNREKRWVARINFDSKQTYLGSFLNELDAAKAYDSGARKFFGESAKLNFPNP